MRVRNCDTDAESSCSLRSRCFAKPERNRRRHAVRIFDTHNAALDAPDLAVALIAVLEDISGENSRPRNLLFMVPTKWFSGSSSTW